MSNSPKNISAIVFLYRKGWIYAKGSRGIYLLYILMFICAQVITVSQPYFIGLLINSIQTATNSSEILSNVVKYSLVVFGIICLFWMLHYPARVLEMRTAFKIRINYREDLFRKLLSLPLSWHQDNPTGDSIDRISRSTTGLYNFLSIGFQALYGITNFCSTMVILTFFMPSVGLICIATSCVIFFLIGLYDRYLNNDFRELNRYENKISSAIHDYISNIVTIVALRIAPLVKKEFLEYLNAPLKLYKKHTVKHELKWCTFSLCSNLVLFGVPIWYAYSNYLNNQIILAGTFYTLFDYLRNLNTTLFNFSALYGNILRQVADVKNSDCIEDAYQAILPSLNYDQLEQDWKTINVSNLSFIYQPALESSGRIKNISLNIKNSQKIAIVGASGCGKSTLLNILGGLHQGVDSKVLVDGKDFSLSSIIDQTALIPQSPEIFIETIRFNVTFGLPANGQEIDYYCKLACFDQVVERLPHGLGSHIAEKGVNLSGGERQRLALARGLFLARNSKILLLDEATSSVDPYNERKIYQNIWQEFSDRSIIASIHRLHLLEMFDYIYVLSKGEIIEEGLYADLALRNAGALARLLEAYKKETN